MLLDSRRRPAPRRPRRRFYPSVLFRAGLGDGKRGLSRSRRRRWWQLIVEQLESRTLLSASILGNVWNDLNGDGVRQAGESGRAGVTVYLDQNSNHVFDNSVTT